MSKTKIVPFIDFIQYDDKKMGNFGFSQVVEANKGKPMNLNIYNLISKQTRQVRITPSNKWGGDSLLGSDIRFENYSLAHCSVYYVESEFLKYKLCYFRSS